MEGLLQAWADRLLQPFGHRRGVSFPRGVVHGSGAERIDDTVAVLWRNVRYGRGVRGCVLGGGGGVGDQLWCRRLRRCRRVAPKVECRNLLDDGDGDELSIDLGNLEKFAENGLQDHVVRDAPRGVQLLGF